MRPKLAPFLRKEIQLVKRTFLILGLLMLTTGCIFGPEINGLPEHPLYPPQILLETLEPPDRGIVDVDSDPDCSPLTFKVGLIRDKNLSDTLYLRWLLIDWDPNDVQIWSDSVINPTDRMDRTGRDYDVDLSEFSVPEVHTFKVVVADRPLLSSESSGAVFPPDESEGQLDTYQWTFRLAPPGSGYCKMGGSE